MPPLNLYARVRFFVHVCTRDRGCSAHPAFPAPSCCYRGRQSTQSSGASRREIARLCLRTNRRLKSEAQVHEAADGMTTADIVHAPSTITVVIRGLDPRIHRASQEAFREDDGLPGQARQ